MSEDCKSDSSTSESEVSACSSSYNPLKALYSDKVKIPVESAPLYENIAQFEAAQSKSNEIIPLGHAKLVQKREEEKEKKRIEEERLLEEKNKRRFAQYQTVMVPTKEYRAKNLLTRIEVMEGPLGVLKECVDRRLRVKGFLESCPDCDSIVPGTHGVTNRECLIFYQSLGFDVVLRYLRHHTIDHMSSRN